MPLVLGSLLRFEGDKRKITDTFPEFLFGLRLEGKEKGRLLPWVSGRLRVWQVLR